MPNNELEHLKYPIGHFEMPHTTSQFIVDKAIKVLEELPEKLQKLVANLTDTQLNTPYRPGGWTIRQVLHHMADSHHNSYTRFKWALTENKPVIKAYEEKSWANLHDGSNAPIQLALDYLTVLHAKLVYLLKGLTAAEMQKSYIHPDDNSEVTVLENIFKYAWHSNHHYAHIANLIKREGW